MEPFDLDNAVAALARDGPRIDGDELLYLISGRVEVIIEDGRTQTTIGTEHEVARLADVDAVPCTARHDDRLSGGECVKDASCRDGVGSLSGMVRRP
jgi:hypothetical protein